MNTHPQNAMYYLILATEFHPNERSDMDILAMDTTPDNLWKLRHAEYGPVKTQGIFYAVVQESYIRQRARGFQL